MPDAPTATLAAQDAQGIERFLAARGWIPDDARVVAVERAGEGNMNLTLRVAWETADGRRTTAIFKHAPPYVHKYPDIAAPAQRVVVEADFYRLVAPHPVLCGRMPRFYHIDEAAHAALMEDLGSDGDYTNLYEGTRLGDDELGLLLEWLGGLHGLEATLDEWPRLANRELRVMNHAQQFEVPLGSPPDGADAPDAGAFCTGLARAAATVRRDPVVRRRMYELGTLYLADGDTLLHGDFHPGSWLRTPAGPRVIDPEFAFFGPPEYDLGVLAAHLHFARDGDRSLDAYPARSRVDTALKTAFTGMELVRRLIGVAQLPMRATLSEREHWLELGVAQLKGEAT